MITASVTQSTLPSVRMIPVNQSDDVLCEASNPSQPSSEERDSDIKQATQTSISESSAVPDSLSDTSQELSFTDSGYGSSDEISTTPASASKALPTLADSTKPETGDEPEDSKDTKIMTLPEAICFGDTIESDKDILPHVSDLISDKMDKLRKLTKVKRLDAIKESLSVTA